MLRRSHLSKRGIGKDDRGTRTAQEDAFAMEHGASVVGTGVQCGSARVSGCECGDKRGGFTGPVLMAIVFLDYMDLNSSFALPNCRRLGKKVQAKNVTEYRRLQINMLKLAVTTFLTFAAHSAMTRGFNSGIPASRTTGGSSGTRFFVNAYGVCRELFWSVKQEPIFM
jgi:hypothetical protein